jgi:hypothetical protein
MATLSISFHRRGFCDEPLRRWLKRLDGIEKDHRVLGEADLVPVLDDLSCLKTEEMEILHADALA